MGRTVRERREEGQQRTTTTKRKKTTEKNTRSLQDLIQEGGMVAGHRHGEERRVTASLKNKAKNRK
jgi:hypothetical protein